MISINIPVLIAAVPLSPGSVTLHLSKLSHSKLFRSHRKLFLITRQDGLVVRISVDDVTLDNDGQWSPTDRGKYQISSTTTVHMWIITLLSRDLNNNILGSASTDSVEFRTSDNTLQWSSAGSSRYSGQFINQLIKTVYNLFFPGADGEDHGVGGISRGKLFLCLAVKIRQDLLCKLKCIKIVQK